MANKIKKKQWTDQEMDFKTFMSLMVVLIPMLLISAEFAKIAMIDIKLPEARGSQTMTKVKKPPKADESSKLLLTAIITDSVVTLGAKSGFLPSVFYEEYHHYIAKDGSYDGIIKFEPGKGEEPLNPNTQERLEIYERYDILLYACDETHTVITKCLYTKFGEMLTDGNSIPAKEVAVGDTLYAVTNPRRMIIVTNTDDFELKKLSVYDQLKNRLMKIKERFKEADDGEDIIIAAENEVMYDKIVQIMDAARMADFPNISIAKLRS